MRSGGSSAADDLVHMRTQARIKERQARSLLDEAGLNSSEFEFLWRLDVAGGSIPSEATLVAVTGFSKAAVTDAINTLERRSLVERRREPGDRRTRPVHILPAGSSMLDEAVERLDRGMPR